MNVTLCLMVCNECNDIQSRVMSHETEGYLNQWSAFIKEVSKYGMND